MPISKYQSKLGKQYRVSPNLSTLPSVISGQRNWYWFSHPDFPWKHLTDEECDRLFNGEGPTPEETAVYEQWKRGLGAYNVKFKDGLGTLKNIRAVQLSDYLLDAIKLSGYLDADEGKLDKKQIRKWTAEAFGVDVSEIAKIQNTVWYNGTVRMAFELALVKLASEKINSTAIIEQASLLRTFTNWHKKLPNLYEKTPTYTIMQQYTTPVPIAWLMNRFLGLYGIKSIATVYDPTAGNGMLLIGANPDNVYANDWDRGYPISSLLHLLVGRWDRITNEDASGFLAGPETKSVDRIIVNPPCDVSYSRVVDGYEMNRIEHQIIAMALTKMKDNGKAAFIIGGQSIDQNGINISPDDKLFFNYLYNNYNVKHNMDIHGDLHYPKGINLPIRLITIDGRKANPGTGIPYYKNFFQAFDYQRINDILEGRGGNGITQEPKKPPTAVDRAIDELVTVFDEFEKTQDAELNKRPL